jgi:hypothetical protein
MLEKIIKDNMKFLTTVTGSYPRKDSSKRYIKKIKCK